AAARSRRSIAAQITRNTNATESLGLPCRVTVSTWNVPLGHADAGKWTYATRSLPEEYPYSTVTSPRLDAASIVSSGVRQYTPVATFCTPVKWDPATICAESSTWTQPRAGPGAPASPGEPGAPFGSSVPTSAVVSPFLHAVRTTSVPPFFAAQSLAA